MSFVWWMSEGNLGRDREGLVGNDGSRLCAENGGRDWYGLMEGRLETQPRKVKMMMVE